MDYEMKISKVPVSDMKPAKYNPRKDLKPGDPAYEKLKRSMTKFGYLTVRGCDEWTMLQTLWVVKRLILC